MRLAVTVRFDVIWRRPGGGDAVLATTTHDFAPNPPGPAQFDAIRFDADLDGAAVAASAGDLLVLRFTTTSGHLTEMPTRPPWARSGLMHRSMIGHEGHHRPPI